MGGTTALFLLFGRFDVLFLAFYYTLALDNAGSNPGKKRNHTELPLESVCSQASSWRRAPPPRTSSWCGARTSTPLPLGFRTSGCVVSFLEVFILHFCIKLQDVSAKNEDPCRSERFWHNFRARRIEISRNKLRYTSSYYSLFLGSYF